MKQNTKDHKKISRYFGMKMTPKKPTDNNRYLPQLFFFSRIVGNKFSSVSTKTFLNNSAGGSCSGTWHVSRDIMNNNTNNNNNNHDSKNSSSNNTNNSNSNKPVDKMLPILSQNCCANVQRHTQQQLDRRGLKRKAKLWKRGEKEK